MIGCDRDVGRATFDHSEHGRENAANGSDFFAFPIACRGQRIVVAEQFVGPVYKINLQVNLLPTGLISNDRRWLWRSRTRAAGPSGSNRSELPRARPDAEASLADYTSNSHVVNLASTRWHGKV